MDAQQATLDLARYPELKAQGGCELVKWKKTSANFQILRARFDPDTGAELEPVVVTINADIMQTLRDAIAKGRADLDARSTALDVLEADMKAIESR